MSGFEKLKICTKKMKFEIILRIIKENDMEISEFEKSLKFISEIVEERTFQFEKSNILDFSNSEKFLVFSP